VGASFGEIERSEVCDSGGQEEKAANGNDPHGAGLAPQPNHVNPPSRRFRRLFLLECIMMSKISAAMSATVDGYLKAGAWVELHPYITIWSAVAVIVLALVLS
jgi:hypothetical protein